MTRRIIAVLFAVLLAALGTAGGLYLVVTADQRAQQRLTDAVTVMIATKRIPPGTAVAKVASEQMYRLERMPRATVPTDAVFELGELGAKVAVANIAAGQLIVKSYFGDRTTVTSGLALPEGKMAVTVETGAPEQVAGYVQPGAQVAIFITYRVLSTTNEIAGLERTRVLLPRVEVLAVGTYQPPSTRTGTASSASARSASLMITVAVDQREAELLIEGLNHGTLYLGLLTGSVDVSVGPGVDNTDDGGDSSPLFK